MKPHKLVPILGNPKTRFHTIRVFFRLIDEGTEAISGQQGTYGADKQPQKRSTEQPKHAHRKAARLEAALGRVLQPKQKQTRHPTFSRGQPGLAAQKERERKIQLC